ncbi:MAG: hypothetical protein ABFS56_07680 [Pseudomonadota bacterium]
MKPLMKLAATAAMALSIGVLPQANAEITLKSNGLGDALIFPVFWGHPGVDNYFTISNRSSKWIQAHLRFRNGTWCGEQLDFDVIFSPGDVLVFRVADVDGDGYWEIDQSLDPHNFAYTGIGGSCGPDTDKGPDNSASELPGSATEMCMNQSDLLIPNATDNLDNGLLDHARNMGYLEVFAEGVFEGMTHEIMADLTNPENAGERAPQGQRQVGNKLGTSLWSWTDAGNGYAVSRRASDVGNWLSGSAFITVAGSGMGIAYNAEAFENFRTSHHQHRIDNYPHDSGVIIHDENSIGQPHGPSPFGDYLYGFKNEDRDDEKRISFNNTWGPTIADGDDYNAPNGCSFSSTNPDIDNWDNEWNDPNFPPFANSICEVETAIRAGGQFYTSFYFAGEQYNNATLSSFYFAVFPTKFFAGERDNLYGQSTRSGYLGKAVNQLLIEGKPTYNEIWDHEERPGRGSGQPDPTADCIISPCIADDEPPPPKKMTLAQCVSVYTVDFIKEFNEKSASFTQGKVIIGCDETFGKACDPKNNLFGNAKRFPTWPFLGYTFEMDGYGIGQWRNMQH